MKTHLKLSACYFIVCRTPSLLLASSHNFGMRLVLLGQRSHGPEFYAQMKSVFSAWWYSNGSYRTPLRSSWMYLLQLHSSILSSVFHKWNWIFLVHIISEIIFFRWSGTLLALCVWNVVTLCWAANEQWGVKGGTPCCENSYNVYAK